MLRKSLGEDNEALLQRGRKVSDVFPEALDGGNAMLGAVKPLGEGNKALLLCARKLSCARSEAQQGRDAMLGSVKLLGEGNEAPLERGRKLFLACPEVLYDGDALLGVVKPFGECNEVLLLPPGQAIDVGRERSDRTGIYQRTKAIRDAWARRRHPVPDGLNPDSSLARFVKLRR